MVCLDPLELLDQLVASESEVPPDQQEIKECQESLVGMETKEHAVTLDHL